MCGLLGVLGPQAREVSGSIEKSLADLIHRGPDDKGFVFDPENSLLLAHRRLAILDLSSAGHQPMSINGDILIFNGEIYNHQNLRQQYLQGENFNSSSDTETLLRLLQKSGLQILPELEGMFAGAWYEKRTKQLHLFRDSLGIKPLFYSVNALRTLYFSSEIKGILSLQPSFKRVINQNVLESYLRTENFSGKETFFQNIFALLPGEILSHSLTSDEIQTRSTRFSWNANRYSDWDESAAVIAIEKEIDNAVSEHLLADVSVGVYLSGGIDSSLVASLAAEKVSSIMGFTGFFDTDDGHYDETPLAQLVATRAGIELHKIKITPEHFLKHFDHLVYCIDQPRMGMGSFSQYVVAQEAAKHRKVILAGHGGDELFAGYPLHKIAWMISLGFKNPIFYKQVFKLKAKEWPWLVYNLMNYLKGKVLFAPVIWSRKTGADSESFKKEHLLENLDSYYKSTYIPGLLDVEDRISMAHSLETRVPLWSQRLLALSMRIPMSKKIENGVLKSILKKIAAKKLPTELLSAPKRGFPTPLRKWFRRELNKVVKERLLNSPCKDFYKIFSKKELARLISSHENSWRPFALDELRAHRIWTALCVESWMRQYLVQGDKK